MARRDLPQALTLERFAAGKDGRANAFKKRKQAHKRKLFEKAQLKREYAKVLKKEGGGGSHAEARHAQDGLQVAANLDGQIVEGKRGGQGDDIVRRKRRDPESLEHEGHAEELNKGGTSPAKRKRPSHRPDPFKEAKVKAEQRRREVEGRQLEREKQKAEKEARAKQRRKKHSLLSKRTRGGQPVMKHTVQHLLDKIQSER